MTPDQFLTKIAKQPIAPAYLLLGSEGYARKMCREALIARALPSQDRIEGVNQIDLESMSLSEALDDARSLSLFATDRVLWVSSVELALPRRLTTSSDEEGGTDKGAEAQLAAYLKAPTQGTTIVFECSRYDFSGDDRTKLERVAKFYAAVPVTVEFRPLAPDALRFLAQQLARDAGLKLGGAELAILLDAVGSDASRLASEIEKLSLYVGKERAVTAEDLQAIVPNASQSTIFSLVGALGQGNRTAALNSLDVLVRDGEYLPLALTFLSTQFRMALAAKEAHITSAQQAQNFFTKMGVRIWRDRAEQVVATANAFSQSMLNRAVACIYETDKKFREGYRDDRVIMETLILTLTAGRTSTR